MKLNAKLFGHADFSIYFERFTCFSFLPFFAPIWTLHEYVYIYKYILYFRARGIYEEARFYRLVVHFIYKVALICYHKKLARMPHGLHLHHGSRGCKGDPRGWVNLIIKVRVERRAKKNRRASLRFEQLFHIPPVSFVCSRVSTYPLSLFSCALPSF